MTYSIEQLKRDAKRKARAEGIPHTQALEALAHIHGYSTYAALRAALSPGGVRFPSFAP